MGKALLTILTTVVAGLILWYLTEIYFREPALPPPPEQLAVQYEKLMAAVVPSATAGNPLADQRVQAAVRNYLSPTGSGEEVTRRLLAEAGYPDGISIAVSRTQFEGSDTALADLSRRLQSIGVELHVMP